MALTALFLPFTTVSAPNLYLDSPKKKTVLGPTMWGNEGAGLDFEATGRRGRTVVECGFHILYDGRPLLPLMALSFDQGGRGNDTIIILR